MLGGLAVYLLGHVAFRFRHIRTVNLRRGVLAAAFLGLVPLATALPAIATLSIVTVAVWILIAIETRSYGENRARVRDEDFAHDR
jgi:hypothetical protein